MRVIKSGHSIIELLSALAILTILISLILLGVQAVRQSARRVHCESNLQQIGLALQNFVGSQKRFPSLLGNRGAKGSEIFVQTAFVSILPELDVGELPTFPKGSVNENSVPGVLRCPANSFDFLAYRFSFGTNLKPRKELNGFMDIFRGRSTADITDGLSNTAAMSERISFKEAAIRSGYVVKTPLFDSADEFANFCGGISSIQAALREHGIDWTGYQPVDISYNHFWTPNSKFYDCQALGRFQVLAARSEHSGGVNTLFCDGSVHWISNGIDDMVWKAVGTIRESEVVNLLQ